MKVNALLKSKKEMPEYPLVMGILNLTVDSFSGDGVLEEKEMREKVAQMLRDGVRCIDIGAESTRPGAVRVSETDEKNRILDAISMIRSFSHDVLISVDTTRASVAHAAIQKGANSINDISGGTFDREMCTVIAANKSVFYIIGHISGDFETMHQKYEGKDIVEDVLSFWRSRMAELENRGVKRDQIICDPGIGFSKRAEENYLLIKNAAYLVERIGVPVLFGVSRKRFIRTLSGAEDNDALDRYSLFLHSALLRDGVSIIRTHEVAFTMKALKIFNTIYA